MARTTSRGAPPPRRRGRRLRWPAWVALCAVVCGVVLAIVLSGGDGGSAASANDTRTNVASCTPGAARSSICPHETYFDPKQYIGHGDAYHCDEFASQADAQAVLRLDPSDPNGLAADNREGVACPALLSHGPSDLKPVAAIVAGLKCIRSDVRSARCPHAGHFSARYYVRNGVDEYDCSAFASQADAQAVLRIEPTDPNELDPDGDGIACPSLPPPKDLAAVITRAPS